MTNTDIRTQVIEFAATYPTPNVRRAVELAEAGTITYQQVYDLCKVAIAKAMA
jgi:hypothetical protein